MKKFFLIMFISVSLVSCSQGGPPGGSANCSEGVCVTLRVVEPVQFNAPIIVMITVTSDKDRSDLGLTLCNRSGEGQATID